MKKLFTLIAMVLATSMAHGQQYVFADKDGNEIADGSTIVRNVTEADPFNPETVIIPSGLFVKNTGDGSNEVEISADVIQIDNGSVQLCFPLSCMVANSIGTIVSDRGTVASNDVKDIETEWLPEGYGKCTVTYTAKTYSGLASIGSQTVTVNYVYADPAAVLQTWWGYVDDNRQRGALGTGSTGVVDQAILISKDNPVVAGKTIKAIRFYLRDLSAISDVKVWLSTTLPASADKANILVEEFPNKALQGGDDGEYYMGKLNEITLSTPYTMGDADIYVGYSYNVTSVSASAGQYPIVLSDEAGVSGSLYLHMASIPWASYGEDYGPLDLRVMVEGAYSPNAVVPLDFGNVYAKVGETGNAVVTLSSAGLEAVNSIDYTITTDGVASAEQHIELASPIAFGKKGTVSISIPGEATQSIKEKTLTVTKVNGAANEAADKDAAFTLYTLNKLIDRNVAVEQFTGTGCGWCPRGHVGMQKMRATFGDRFVGIAIHQYSGQSSDAMYIASASYAKHGLTSAPSCRLNRGDKMDPYYGAGNDILDDFRAAMNIPAMAELQVSGVMDAEKATVEAKAAVEPLFDSNYTLEFVLVADELKGTGTGWNQTNYYSSAYASQTGITKATLPNDLQYLYDLGSTFNPTFNDVAIASSYKSSKNQVEALTLTADTPQEVSYTLTMPTYAKLKSALQDDHIYVIALLVDSNGQIVQAAKQQVTLTAPDGIDAVEQTAADSITARYMLDGRQVTAPQRGLNIIRMANGRTVKVVIK